MKEKTHWWLNNYVAHRRDRVVVSSMACVFQVKVAHPMCRRKVVASCYVDTSVV